VYASRGGSRARAHAAASHTFIDAEALLHRVARIPDVHVESGQTLGPSRGQRIDGLDRDAIQRSLRVLAGFESAAWKSGEPEPEQPALRSVEPWCDSVGARGPGTMRSRHFAAGLSTSCAAWCGRSHAEASGSSPHPGIGLRRDGARDARMSPDGRSPQTVRRRARDDSGRARSGAPRSHVLRGRRDRLLPRRAARALVGRRFEDCGCPHGSSDFQIRTQCVRRRSAGGTPDHAGREHRPRPRGRRAPSESTSRRS